MLRQIPIWIDFLNSYYPTDYICRPGYFIGDGLFPNCSIEKLSDDFTSLTQRSFQKLPFFAHRLPGLNILGGNKKGACEHKFLAFKLNKKLINNIQNLLNVG